MDQSGLTRLPISHIKGVLMNFEFLPFGSGRRVCPGLNMGIAAIELALANLLYCFNWELPSGISKEDINMDEISDFTLRKKFPLHLIPIKHNWQ
ncbi:hypothetical protein IFM89_006640 [Coptis chinensis]|uniref:Cytochrome P450 n=1 Tax=Coptis chinensis TaxID=261450 RepID=A0A835HL78_9MAGN|nr:hypothetical protein IFM89_006640 [Coptis chinensis]